MESQVLEVVKIVRHYCDIIMGAIASQITSLPIVYSTVYSDADQKKHQNSASLAFVWGIHRDRWIPRTKGQLRGKCFHLMTSSCLGNTSSRKCHLDHKHQYINSSLYFCCDVKCWYWPQILWGVTMGSNILDASQPLVSPKIHILGRIANLLDFHLICFTR